MSVTQEDPNGRFEFINPVSLEQYGNALGYFDRALEELGLERRTTKDFSDFLMSRPDIARYIPNPDVGAALSPHEAISWATMPDGTAVGVILSRRETGNTILIGSMPRLTDEKVDAQRIAAFGTKVTKKELQGWISLLDKK